MLPEESGLLLPRIVEKTKAGFRYLKPRVFSGAKDKAYKAVSGQAKTLINEMKGAALPLSKEIEQGIDVESRLNNNLNRVERIAGNWIIKSKAILFQII